MRQKTRFRNHLIIASALLLLFTLLSLSLKRSTVLKKVEGLVVSLTAPGLQGIHYVSQSLKRLWLGYVYLVGVERENAALKRRLDEALQKEVGYQEALHALKRLETLLDLKREVALPVSSARVIAYDPSLWSRCVILDQGKSRGIKAGLPVLAPGGIAGRVVEAYPGYAKVMLIVDRNSGADALVQRSRVRGILQGKGANRCSLEYVPKKADVQVGDLVISSGLNGIYPQGLIFGKVTGADKKTPGVFQEIEVTPAVDLSALEEVLVVKTVELLPPS
ncbi:MAG: rod shape-determining protein MreC [Deltaproteobacteria bacterium RBG_13_58_19]|nr:MAG: rod shape-determining protein MreC [Deltaproteobacteria bacterium RBG_13_58_19]